LGILVLEGRTVGTGGSGRNGGLMLNWVNGVDSKDPVLTPRVWAATLEGIDLIEGMIREYQLPVRYRRTGALDVFTSAAQAEAAAAQVEKLNSWGIPLRYLDRAALAGHCRVEAAVGGVFDPTAGHLHGLDYVRALKDLLLRSGVQICEHSPVTRLEPGAEVRLHTPEGQVRARAAVLATNAWTHQLGFFRSGLFPLHSHVLAVGPLSPEERAQLGWTDTVGFVDDKDRISYGCLDNDGHVIFGGGSNSAYSYLYGNGTAWKGGEASAAPAHEAIHQLLLQYLPGLAGKPIRQRWTGAVGLTMSRVCTMGVMGEARNIYYAVGFAGHGVTLANLAGRVLADVYDGNDARWQGLPFYQRPIGGIPPEPFRWVGYHVYTRLTGRSPRKTGA
jgi:glycine/D-amino acid oxidase-like deaminating enzyme